MKQDWLSCIQRGECMKKGIDISYHQGNVDFNAVKRSGIEFAILREGYRNTIDAKFLEYARECKAAGLPILAVYHFSYALNEEEAKKEADFCLANMKKAGLGKEVEVFFDFEYDTVKKAASKGVLLNRPECNKHTIAFCDQVKMLGYTPGVYTNLDYYKNWYDKSVLSKYKVWLADYTGGPDYDCQFQQYSSKGSIPGIKGAVDLDYLYDDIIQNQQGDLRKVYSRNEVIRLAQSWIGKNEADGSFKSIIDTYNSYSPLPRGYKMKYTDSWCACTWSALTIALGYTDIMPIEVSCIQLINKAKSMGIWQENDGYTPQPGDAVLYDWQDNGNGDNAGQPDHVGVVDYVNKTEGYFTVVEGNYNNAVKKRTISINGKFIRGFICPKYNDNSVVVESTAKDTKDVKTVALEVISGLWDSGVARKKALEASGFNYTEVQAKVNEILKAPSKTYSTTCKPTKKDSNLAADYITTANLNLRNDAGTNKKILCTIPKGSTVVTNGAHTMVGNTKWVYVVTTVNNKLYDGFCSSQYLKLKGE